MKAEQLFELDGKSYPYWNVRKNERCVEVALGIDFFKDAPPRIMEVGNVMRMHQSSRKHFVIDLHEKHKGWLNYKNEDVLTWSPNRNLERVLSISTLEHCEDPVKAIQRVKSWAPEVLITIPLGYNSPNGLPTTELALMDHGMRASYMARTPLADVGTENWRQVSREAIEAADPETLKWGQLPEPCQQSAVAICILRK